MHSSSGVLLSFLPLYCTHNSGLCTHNFGGGFCVEALNSKILGTGG